MAQTRPRTSTKVKSAPEPTSLLYFLQVATSSFPTGAFSHSYGFEQLIAEESITNADSLQRELHLWLRYGVAAADAGASRHSAVLAFLHGSFSSLVGVAARLIPLGQIATQRIITDAGGVIEDCCEASLATGIDELATTTPALDLASMAHERLYTRLCIS